MDNTDRMIASILSGIYSLKYIKFKNAYADGRKEFYMQVEDDSIDDMIFEVNGKMYFLFVKIWGLNISNSNEDGVAKLFARISIIEITRDDDVYTLVENIRSRETQDADNIDVWLKNFDNYLDKKMEDSSLSYQEALHLICVYYLSAHVLNRILTTLKIDVDSNKLIDNTYQLSKTLYNNMKFYETIKIIRNCLIEDEIVIDNSIKKIRL